MRQCIKGVGRAGWAAAGVGEEQGANTGRPGTTRTRAVTVVTEGGTIKVRRTWQRWRRGGGNFLATVQSTLRVPSLWGNLEKIRKHYFEHTKTHSHTISHTYVHSLAHKCIFICVFVYRCTFFFWQWILWASLIVWTVTPLGFARHWP